MASSQGPVFSEKPLKFTACQSGDLTCSLLSSASIHISGNSQQCPVCNPDCAHVSFGPQNIFKIFQNFYKHFKTVGFYIKTQISLLSGPNKSRDTWQAQALISHLEWVGSVRTCAVQFSGDCSLPPSTLMPVPLNCYPLMCVLSLGGVQVSTSAPQITVP